MHICFSSTIRLYASKDPAKAKKQFVSRVCQTIHCSFIRESTSQDLEKSRFSNCEWHRASECISKQLDQKLKEPTLLLFFSPGAKYEITYNKEYEFSQSQLAQSIEIPSQNDLDSWRKIKVLIAPPGIRDKDYDPKNSIENYKEIGLKLGWIGYPPLQTNASKNFKQGNRKQYGLRYSVTGTIHSTMGDTLSCMATEIS